MKKFTELDTFRVIKTTLFSTFLMRLGFQGYRCIMLTVPFRKTTNFKFSDLLFVHVHWMNPAQTESN